MPPQLDPIRGLFEAARALVTTYQPGHTAARVIVVMEDGRKAADLTVPLYCALQQDSPPPSARQAEAPKLNEMEAAVIEALGHDEMSGPEIAEAAGYPYDRQLKGCLAALRRRGILTGAPGEEGYSVASP